MSPPALERLFDLVKSACREGELPVVLLDVDSTLFSTAERHRRILVDFAVHRGDEAMLAVALGTRSTDFGWSVDGPVRAAGIDDEALLSELADWWYPRFFSDAYCALDVPTPGAVSLVRDLAHAGALCVYLTGRVADAMEQGTVRLLRTAGFPLHDGRTMLVMKPSHAVSDRQFKGSALDHLRRLGRVVGTFENEPGHANAFAAAFPGGVHVLLDTVHSPGAPAPSASVHVLATLER